ncbi:MAG: penicillin-binding protein 2 [Firmicutes bacterium]|nr:penicillin-binding protein 2 [Bacillota bacterium]
MVRKVIEKRSRVMLLLLGLVFALLVGRLAYLQLLETERFQTLARENRVRLIPIVAPRGEIFDRHGQKLVANRPVYTVSLVYLGQRDLPAVAERLAAILGQDAREIEAKMTERSLRLFEPVKIARGVPMEVITKIEERREELPGVVVDAEPVRDYPRGSLAAQVLGYVREISEQELAANREKGYRPGDLFGKDGLERAFEDYLRGKDGAREVEVDALARPVRDLGVRPPQPGNNLILTLDARVQEAAERALDAAVQAARRAGHPDARGGAVVVEDVRTGGIIAMASHPTYDPAVFTSYLSDSQARELFSNPDRLMLNRAIAAAYPPGSTFKMVVAAAGLESQKVDPEAAVPDPGYLVLGNRTFRDWKPGGHGRVDLRRAIQVSCDVYFWRLGLTVGIEEVARVAREFGLDRPTGIELPGETGGVVPTPEYKYALVKKGLDRRYKPKLEEIEARYASLLGQAQDPEVRRQLEAEKQKEIDRVLAQYNSHGWDLQWQTYDTLNTSIGQGYNLYTPLQLANYVAAIANGGNLWKPHLVQRIVAPDGQVIKETAPQLLARVNVRPETLAIIREGMALVTQGEGTAAGIFGGFPVPVAGKTGTAEVTGKEDHSLFVAFAPADDPQVAVAVVVEHAGHGSTVAAPVAREVLEAYFGLE